MWKKPWSFKEGIAIGVGLLITGLLLQFTVGAINWSLFAMPVNVIVLAIFIAAIVAIHCMRRRVHAFMWMGTYPAAIVSLIFTAVATLVMGFTRQQTQGGIWGISQMLSFWPFVLTYTWMTLLLGVTVMRAFSTITWRRVPFFLNHLGLFIVLTAATLGNADMQRLTMNVAEGSVEWRAMDGNGELKEMDLAIELNDFSIDEYPPKLLVVHNETGEALPAGAPQHILLEEGTTEGTLYNGQWHIAIDSVMPYCAMVPDSTGVRYEAYYSLGATTAAHVKAQKEGADNVIEGWVSCGSFVIPFNSLKLDDECSLVMPELEPRRYASAVTVYSKAGEAVSDTITVNHPLKIEGWNIYQLSYDDSKGRWSDVSVFELVRDPWLPVVYLGIIMMALGAVCMFVDYRKKFNGGEKK